LLRTVAAGQRGALRVELMRGDLSEVR